MIRAAVLSTSDRFHQELRQCAADAGLRVELVVRTAGELRSAGGLDVVVVHRPTEDDLESIKEAVGALPIVVAGPAGIHPDSVQNQDGWAVVADDDFPAIAASARAAALGLSVTSVGESESAGDDGDDLTLTPMGRAYANGHTAGHGTLTIRESEVLQLVASGATNREIAAGLGISDNTVKYHLAGLYSKMNVARRSEVIFEAIRRGLISI